MNTRQKSINIMQLLRPLIQCGVITAATASSAIKEYQHGNNSKLNDICNMDIPYSYNEILNNIRETIENK